ncbi:hypothetical protein B0P06_002842 [Clostridium saccharoperbutylacetonicum]|nr:hypothetical protein [Clostridium saccharoperbutylacetonicum]
MNILYKKVLNPKKRDSNHKAMLKRAEDGEISVR